MGAGRGVFLVGVDMCKRTEREIGMTEKTYIGLSDKIIESMAEIARKQKVKKTDS